MTAVAVHAHRPGIRALGAFVVAESKMVARDTAGLIVPLALPLLILVMNASAAGAEEVVPGRSALEVYVLPLVFTIVLATICIVNMPSFLASYRRTGVLKRLAATPVSPVLVLLAQAIVSLAQAALGIGLAWAVAAAVFGARPPLDMPAALAGAGLAIAAMYGVGMLVASFAPTPNSSVAIGLVLFFAFGALGGLFGPTAGLPDALAVVGAYLPFGASVDVLQAAWSGLPQEPGQLAALAAWAAGGTALGAAAFRWT